MPYIIPERRKALHYTRYTTVESAGELNYEITKLLVGYVKHKGLCYQTINDILGALSGASAEFYRRVAGPYEDKAIARNGDVYPSD